MSENIKTKIILYAFNINSYLCALTQLLQCERGDSVICGEKDLLPGGASLSLLHLLLGWGRGRLTQLILVGLVAPNTAAVEGGEKRK